MTPTEKELEQAFEKWAEAKGYSLDKRPNGVFDDDDTADAREAYLSGRAEGQREVFERACEAVCRGCEMKLPLEYKCHREPATGGVMACYAGPIRAAFTQFSKPGEGQ